jgi:hypothetical protein
MAEHLRAKPRPLLGLVMGLTGGSLFSLFALVAYMVRGPASFERIGIPMGSVVGLYLICGLAGGLLLGLLLPLTVLRWGAALVGILVALPLYAGAGLLLGDFNWRLSLVLAAIIGGVVGFRAWEPVPKGESLPGENSVH